MLKLSANIQENSQIFGNLREVYFMVMAINDNKLKKYSMSLHLFEKKNGYFSIKRNLQ